MKTALSVMASVALGASLMAQGQTAPRQAPPDKKPMATASQAVEAPRSIYELYKGFFVAAAAEMPEANYGFHPTTMPAADGKEVRTYGQIVAHIASENYMFCSSAEGTAWPEATKDYEKTKTTKADLAKALAESYAYCDKVWSATSEQNMNTPGKWPAGMPTLPGSTRMGILTFNTAHSAEHYGNLVTYLRARGLVPPSSGGK
jgi:uncharacterized damage-inducible protein DinB